jgi:lactam utilization protein B
MSRSRRELSDASVDAVVRFDKKLIVLGPAQSELLFAAQDAGLNAAVELPITSVDELSEDSSLGSGYASLSVDAAEPYAVQLLDEIRRDMHKKGLKLAPLRDLHLG